MGNTSPRQLPGGGVDAVESEFGDGGAPAFRGPATGRRGDEPEPPDRELGEVEQGIGTGEAGIPLNQALDRVAEREGFQSWSLLVARSRAQSAAANNHSRKTQITALPLAEPDRAEFVEIANEVFEAVLERIEAENPEATRKLWNADHYVDKVLLTDDMLPISRAYALSLIDAFLVHHVIDLAVQADEQAARR
jgi:hypothetical protein